MISIYYMTHQKHLKSKLAYTLEETAVILRGLWQARMKAKAFDHKGRGPERVGGVHKVDGVLTWWCEGHDFDKDTTRCT